ncbi:biopolymer transporter ExbD [Pedobacter changchengzhani]|uniref:Biopolymer transporter ExbD n=1 Tax=Pedobacter changchengzhani TaxID=2529274 RepID=A0A4R5MNL9_9SPHI|nr:biopolymer transporter ExbD [Pedobacter changchengzhani]TDG37268.1 biopolymer transporter ExbD [Pedobacter changchengzhani]
MASLNLPKSGKATSGRSNKTSPRVDLTAMVDLMFLLTTFFMLTTSLGEFNAIDIAKPVDMNPEPVTQSRTMTILLGKNNQSAYYMGDAKSAVMKIGNLKNIQDEISSNKKKIKNLYLNDPTKYMIVIIKPTKTSIYKNFVDVVDEMKIADIKSYLVDDANILAQEKTFLETKGI